MWTLWLVPMWFAATLFTPFGAGALTLVPATGMVCFIAGLIWCLVRPARELLWLGVPFVLSQIMLLIGALLWEKLSNDQATLPILAFLGIQAVVIGCVTYRLRHRIGPALLLAIFNVAYALFAGFVATMAMTGSWL
jgi:hypothetical protein